ncbi:MAG TPA: DHH family phosphoesterase, partial [Patescibacteria group bacterium]
MRDKRWVLKEQVTEEFKNKFPEIDEIVLQLLYDRQLDSQEKIDEFLNPDYSQDIHDPFLFQDMPAAVERVYQAIEKKEKITVHGDYDADGVSGSAILVSSLKRLGADVDVYIPHREKDGYGINAKTVEFLHQQKTDLIITTDCGISNKAEIDKAQDLG